jgi:hypothetical protein
MYQRGIPIDMILFSDTGSEHPHTYDFINIFNGWLAKRDLPEITMVFYTDKRGNRLTLEDECLRSGTLPSIAYGYKKCSHKHKIGPQDKHCNNHPGCRAVRKSGQKLNKYIGYDAGESRRVEHALTKAENSKCNYLYPLFTWGWDREKCVRVIEREGLEPPGKSSCFFCPSMKKTEIQSLWEQHPELFQRAIDIERAAAGSLVTVKGLGRKWSWENYRSAFLEAMKYEKAQLSLFDFVDAPGGCICGAPCGCYDG